MVESGSHSDLVGKDGGVYACMVAHGGGGERNGRAPEAKDVVVVEVDGEEAVGASREDDVDAANGTEGLEDVEVLEILGREEENGLAASLGSVPPPDPYQQHDGANESQTIAPEEGTQAEVEPLAPGAESSFKKLWRLSSKELPVALVGVLGSAAFGLILPLFGLLLGSIIADMYIPDPTELRQRVWFWCGILVALGKDREVGSLRHSC